MSENVAVNATRLHAQVDGALGPWVVLLNSLAADLSMWDPQIPALTQRFRVLRYDQRGHGGSAAPAAPYSLANLVDDLFALMAHYRIERAHLVGLSLGGVIAAGAALARPQQVASFAVCDSRLEMPTEFLSAIDERNRLVRAQGMEAIVEPMLVRWFSPAGIAARLPALDQVRAMIRRTHVEGFVGCGEALKTARVLDRLAEVRLPSLFLVGDQDAAVPAAVMQDQRARVTGSAYVEIERAGHLANLEQPAHFNAALLGFLK